MSAWEPFAEAIARGDKDRVVALLEALDEAGRTRLGKDAQRTLRALPEFPQVADYGDWERYAREDASVDAARTAVFGTGGSAAAAQAWWLPHERDRLLRLLRRLALERDAAVTDPGAREGLASLSPTSKIGRAAREALAVGSGGA